MSQHWATTLGPMTLLSPEALASTEEFCSQLEAFAQVRAEMESGSDLRWSSPQQMCLAEGGPGRDGRPMTVAGPLALPKGVEPGMPKGCWGNAWALAKRGARRGAGGRLTPGRFLYVEGYASPLLTSPTPGGRPTVFAVGHAWCLDQESGEIVDPTWSREAQIGPRKVLGHVYLGVAFSPAFMEQAIAETRRGHDRHISIFESDHAREARMHRLGFTYGAPDDPVLAGLVTGWGPGVPRS